MTFLGEFIVVHVQATKRYSNDETGIVNSK